MFYKRKNIDDKFKEISAWIKVWFIISLITSSEQKHLEIDLGNNAFNILWRLRKLLDIGGWHKFSF